MSVIKAAALLARIKEAVAAGPTRRHVSKYEPSEAQKETGNYPKFHVNMHGMSFSIENPKGSYRRGTSPSGKPWATLMKRGDYGYIRGTEAIDGDAVDVFMSPRASDATVVHIVDQVYNGKFDEHKCMIGWATQAAAKEAYLANYESGWSGLGAITTVCMDEFKKWVKSRDVKKPYSRQMVKA